MSAKIFQFPKKNCSPVVIDKSNMENNLDTIDKELEELERCLTKDSFDVKRRNFKTFEGTNKKF